MAYNTQGKGSRYVMTFGEAEQQLRQVIVTLDEQFDPASMTIDQKREYRESIRKSIQQLQALVNKLGGQRDKSVRGFKVPRGGGPGVV